MQFRLTRARSGLAAVVLTIALMATACGGGGDDEASPGPDATSAPASDGGAEKTTGEGGGVYCDLLADQAAQLTAYLAGAATADPAARTQFIATQKELNNKVLQAAPAGIRSDVETQVRASNALADAQISGDPAAITAASGRLTTPEYQAATSRVGVFNKAQCGIDVTSPGGS